MKQYYAIVKLGTAKANEELFENGFENSTEVHGASNCRNAFFNVQFNAYKYNDKLYVLADDFEENLL